MPSTTPPTQNGNATIANKDNGFSSHSDHYHDDDDEDHDDTYPTTHPPRRSFLSRSIYHLRHHWKIVVLGQLLSLCLATAGASQATLHLHCNITAPTFTMGALYLSLALVHFPLLCWRQGKERQEQRQLAHTTHQVLLVERARYDYGSLQLQRPIWQYIIMAILDVEANAVTVLAFKYTTLTSVTLLDALAIPSSMMISKFFLARQYTWVHIAGVMVCIVGVLVNVLQDAESDLDATTVDERYPHKVWGDILATTGGIMFGLNDVLAEATVRKNASTTEYLSMIGLFGFLLSLVQASFMERDSILEFFGRDPADNLTCSVPQGWGLLALFVGVTLTSYMGASRFLMVSEAAFFNLSLLTGDLWSVVFSIVGEKIVPKPFFFVALVFVLGGVVLYEMAPHPVVEDAAALMAAQQLADIDHEFELQERNDGDDSDNDDDENDMELL